MGWAWVAYIAAVVLLTVVSVALQVMDYRCTEACHDAGFVHESTHLDECLCSSVPLKRVAGNRSPEGE